MTHDLEREISGAELAAVFGEVTSWAAPFGALLLEHLPLDPASRVLDLGCATGYPLFELAHTLGGAARLVGVDPWPEAVTSAEQRRTIYCLPNVALLRGDGAALPLADAAFDLVVSNLGINNFHDAGATLGECARVLRPGGVLALTTNPCGTFHELYRAMEAVLRQAGDEAGLQRLAADEERRGGEASLRARVRAAGLRVRRSVARRRTLRFASGAALLRHWLIRVGFLRAWREVLGGQGFERLEALESALDGTAGHGGLRMSVPMLYLEAERPA